MHRKKPAILTGRGKTGFHACKRNHPSPLCSGEQVSGRQEASNHRFNDNIAAVERERDLVQPPEGSRAMEGQAEITLAPSLKRYRTRNGGGDNLEAPAPCSKVGTP